MTNETQGADARSLEDAAKMCREVADEASTEAVEWIQAGDDPAANRCWRRADLLREAARAITERPEPSDPLSPILDDFAVEEAAIRLMEFRGGPGEPMRAEAKIAVRAYLGALNVSLTERPEPSVSPDADRSTDMKQSAEVEREPDADHQPNGPPAAVPSDRQEPRKHWQTVTPPGADRQDARAEALETLREVRECAAAWVPDVRLMGDVRAGDFVAMCDALAAAPLPSGATDADQPSGWPFYTPKEMQELAAIDMQVDLRGWWKLAIEIKMLAHEAGMPRDTEGKCADERLLDFLRDRLRATHPLPESPEHATNGLPEPAQSHPIQVNRWVVEPGSSRTESETLGLPHVELVEQLINLHEMLRDEGREDDASIPWYAAHALSLLTRDVPQEPNP